MTDKTKQKTMHQWGPSDTTRPDGVEVKALTKEMISEIVNSYREVAGLVKRAGFEMLMIHGGHGGLINQFLSPYFNKRTDEYGGSLENRCRLAIEVLKAVREAVGPFSRLYVHRYPCGVIRRYVKINLKVGGTRKW